MRPKEIKMKSKQNQIKSKLIFDPAERCHYQAACIAELSHVRVIIMAGEWEKLNKKVRPKRNKKDPPFKVLKNHRRSQSQQQFTGCIQAVIEMEGRFPFSPKFRKFRLEMKRTSSVRSDWNIWGHLWRWSTLTGPVISVGPTELSLSILTKLFSLVPLFCILLTRTITRRAVAWVGSVQTECTVPLGTWALTELLNGKHPKCRILIAH